MGEFLATNGAWLTTLVVGVLTTLAGIVSVRAKSQSDRDAARAPEWVGLTSQQTELLQFMRSQLADQEKRIQALEAESRELAGKYWRLIAWVRRVLADNPTLLATHPLHETVRDDI